MVVYRLGAGKPAAVQFHPAVAIDKIDPPAIALLVLLDQFTHRFDRQPDPGNTDQLADIVVRPVVDEHGGTLPVGGVDIHVDLVLLTGGELPDTKIPGVDRVVSGYLFEHAGRMVIIAALLRDEEG